MKSLILLLALLAFACAEVNLRGSSEDYIGCIVLDKQGQCCWLNSNSCCKVVPGASCIQEVTTCCKMQLNYPDGTYSYVYHSYPGYHRLDIIP